MEKLNTTKTPKKFFIGVSVFFLFFILIGIVVFLFITLPMIKRNAYLVNAPEIEAMTTGIEAANKENYYVLYTFTDNEGVIHKDKSKLSYSLYKATEMHENGKLIICYDGTESYIKKEQIDNNTIGIIITSLLLLFVPSFLIWGCAELLKKNSAKKTVLKGKSTTGIYAGKKFMPVDMSYRIKVKFRNSYGKELTRKTFFCHDFFTVTQLISKQELKIKVYGNRAELDEEDVSYDDINYEALKEAGRFTRQMFFNISLAGTEAMAKNLSKKKTSGEKGSNLKKILINEMQKQGSRTGMNDFLREYKDFISYDIFAELEKEIDDICKKAGEQ